MYRFLRISDIIVHHSIYKCIGDKKHNPVGTARFRNLFK